MHTQLNRIIRDSKPPVEPVETAWTPEELKHFWALANTAHGRAATDRVYDMMALQCKKFKMHELSRPEFRTLLNELRWQAGRDLDEIFRETSMEPIWLRVRHLQRSLKWTDTRLVNYALFHGRKSGCHVDSLRWLTVDKLRAIAIGLDKILDRERAQR